MSAGDYFAAFSISDADTTGYINFPPKAGAYKWYLGATVKIRITNDGTNGDVIAAGSQVGSVWMYTSSTLGGAAVESTEIKLYSASGLTATGGQVVELHAALQVPITESSVTGTSLIAHINYAVGNMSTAGSTGVTIAAQEIHDLQIIGYPSTPVVSYTNVTYEDSAGVVRQISKDDRFIDYYGKLSKNYDADPNLSVRGIMVRRISSRMHCLSQLVNTLIAYSSKHHKGGDTLDAKYIRLGCPNGIVDMLKVMNWLDNDSPPFAASVTGTVTNPDDISYLIVTFIEDLKLVLDSVDSDQFLQGVLASYFSLTTSSNVHYM
jgi:hypothetical protein